VRDRERSAGQKFGEERRLKLAGPGDRVARWHFINPGLTVHLFREAEGEWICLDAQSFIALDLAISVFSDALGLVGTGAQSPFAAPRP
jgi:hypothetical protein